MIKTDNIIYDVAIIGGGIAGLSAALQGSRSGLNVILFEKEDLGGLSFNGGDLLWAKLYQGAIEYKAIKEKYNIDLTFNLYDRFSELEELRQMYLTEYKKILGRRKNFTLVHAKANIIEVGKIEADGQRYLAKNIIIAIGAKARHLDIGNVEEVIASGFYLKSHEIRKLPKLPNRIVIAGGSTIAFELAIFFANVGTKVTMLVQGKILEGLDSDMREMYLELIAHKNLKIITGANTRALNEGEVTYTKDSKLYKIKTDHFISAIGFSVRLLKNTQLKLDYDESGYITNNFGQTNIPTIYAIGNANNKPKYSNRAIAEGTTAINHILGRFTPLDYRFFIRQIIGFYQYAQYGDKEETLIEQGVLYVKKTNPPTKIGNTDQGIKYFKILFSKFTHEVLGIHLISKKAHEHINVILNTLKFHTLATSFSREAYVSEAFLVGGLINEILAGLILNTINNEYISFYQPKVDLATNKIIGAESLARFYIEEAYRSPLPFINAFEKNGYIAELDFQSIHNACNLLIELEKNKLLKPDFTISVNLSPKTLALICSDKINNIIENYQVDKKHFVFEITERNLEEGLDFIENVRKLQAIGYKISMDDFSVGNSSLAFLNFLSFDEVKIDMAVLPKDENDHDGKILYKNLVQVLRIKKIELTAEGVETIFHDNFLKELGINTGQGYFYSRPLNKEAFMALLKKD